MDDYVNRAWQWMRDNPDEVEARLPRAESILGGSVETAHHAGRWVARMGQHAVGVGDTAAEAERDLWRKLLLVMGGPDL